MLPLVKLLMLMLLSQVMVEAKKIEDSTVCYVMLKKTHPSIMEYICNAHCRDRYECEGGYCNKKWLCVCKDCPETAEPR
ncbi:unnamed protein product [Cylicocyclus nassatus]|uniref:Invertebrate defensins family profile domain-containing protein n=1 Tax=Cylicocyclus nassatus TaxID=53992 RepID=A0AA36MCW3_CYLNA|nr:unnamed protein product [Cylicocyclus nassatus]